MTRDVLDLEPIADDPEVGRWLAAMQDARRDTLRELDDLTDAALGWRPSPDADSISTILYHVALIEADWLLVDILGAEAPAWPTQLLPFAARNEEQHLTGVEGQTLAQHLERLSVVREMLLRYLKPMSSADFVRMRPGDSYDVSAVWVIHHLLQHEAEHRSQIGALKQAWQRSAAQ
jgi:uncharacterized damage-inducible protein DinB